MTKSLKEFSYDRSFVPNVVEHSLALVICVREVSGSVLKRSTIKDLIFVYFLKQGLEGYVD
jgi:hypothetical protein